MSDVSGVQQKTAPEAAFEVELTTETDATTIGPIVRLASWTGLRLGELLALRWDDLDLDNARLTVRRMLNNYGEIDEPKSRRSLRTITLSAGTVAMLREVGKAQNEERLKIGPAYQDQDYVFADPVGNPRPQFSVNHLWRWAVKRAKVPHATIHGLRHAHASHLLADGWELSAVAERLGHSRTSITLDFYSHALPNRNAELAESIDRIFGVVKKVAVAPFLSGRNNNRHGS